MTPFAQGVESTSEDFLVKRGKTFRFKVKFYEDEAKTKPQSLAGWTPRLIIAGYLQLTVGAGLTVNAATGEVFVVLTPAQTAAAPRSQLHYFLELEEPEDNVEPLEGTLTFIEP